MESDHSICCICLDELSESITTPCNHRFHSECLNAIVRPVCPLCDQDISDMVGIESKSDPEQESESEPESIKCRTFNQMIDYFIEMCGMNDILFRRDFTCCSNCGHSEIHNKIEEGDDWEGYAFYHIQSTDTLIESINASTDDIETSVYLGWGLFNESNSIESVQEDSIESEPIRFAQKISGLADEFTKEIMKRVDVSGLFGDVQFSFRIEYQPIDTILTNLKLMVHMPKSFYENHEADIFFYA